MKKKTYVSHGFAILSIGLLAFFGMASNCSSTSSATKSSAATTAGVSTVSYSEYAAVPSYPWESLGIVVVRLNTTDSAAVSAALMEEAVKLGADDIINIRVDATKNKDGTFTVLAATATAIKYVTEPAAEPQSAADAAPTGDSTGSGN